MRFKDLWREIVEDSKRARQIIWRHIHVTPVNPSTTISRMAGGTVFLKYENLQKTGSFKVRGALYKTYSVMDRVKGVAAASAGNHAQGVAYAATALGLPSVIVMPETATISKVEATRGYGAEVILHGKVFDEALAKAKEIARERGYEIIHAFDDPQVIAGQGTIGLELLEQLGDFDVLIASIGGGGLIAGIASVVKWYRPNVKIVGVEPQAAPKMLMSLKAGRPVTLEPKPSVADGLLTKRPGEITFEIVSNLVDDIVTVDEEELAHTIYFLLERKKTLTEGAGAASVAPLLFRKVDVSGRKVVAVLSGGNIDLTVLNKIIIRGLSKSGKIVKISGYVPDYPGQLKRVLEIVAAKRGNILDILHDRIDPATPAWHARVILLLELPSIRVAEEIIEDLSKEGYIFSIERGSPQ